MSIRIAFDWVEASPSTDLLAQSTMAALTIEVDGYVVTSVLDRRSRSCRNHVVTPLVYVAEWLVANWWRLFHEVENERTPRGDFAETHDLAFAGEGFLLPSLTIAPTPQKMRLRWKRYRPLHSEIEFTEQGEALVDRHDFGEAVQTIVEATRGRRGYDLAQAARAQLAPASDRYDFAADGPNALPFVEMQPPPHCHIQGLVAADSPVCAIAARGTARRFLQARALGDYLGRAEHGPAILSGLVTDRQAQSRAFAAEFLAPAASLGRRLRGRHTHPDEVDELAAAFGVSSYVVRHQIQNHGLADCTEW